MHINEIIKNIRKDKGISQKNIAKTLGISISGYNMKENGNRPITTTELQQIAIALKEQPEYFFNQKLHDKWKVR